jgi:hypothetical protein
MFSCVSIFEQHPKIYAAPAMKARETFRLQLISIYWDFWQDPGLNFGLICSVNVLNKIDAGVARLRL